MLTGGFCSLEEVSSMCSSANIMQAQHVRLNVRVESDYALHAKAASLLKLSVL